MKSRNNMINNKLKNKFKLHFYYKKMIEFKKILMLKLKKLKIYISNCLMTPILSIKMLC